MLPHLGFLFIGYLVVFGFDKASEDWIQVFIFARTHFNKSAVCPAPVILLFFFLNVSFCRWPCHPEWTLSCLTAEAQKAWVQIILRWETFHSISNFGLRDQNSLEEPPLHGPCWFLCYFYAIDSEAKPFHAGEEPWIPISFLTSLWSLVMLLSIRLYILCSCSDLESREGHSYK